MKRLLFIALCCLWAVQSFSQSYFNVRNPLHSFSSGFTSVVPLHDNYYGIGFSWDSTNLIPGTVTAYPVWGIKFAKFGPDGSKLIDTFFQKPGVRPDITTWDAKAILLEDHTVLVPADNIDTNNMMRLALYCFDTLGQVLWEKEYDPPTYGNSGFWRMVDLKQTNDGHWLLLSTVIVPSVGNRSQINLTKLDENFNLVWHKHYGDLWRDIAGKILIEPDGSYLISGARSNQIYADPIKLIGQIQFLRTDTAGNVLGQWRTDTSHLHSLVYDLIRTSDGGYLYVGSGEGWQNPDYLINYHYNGWIEKLDSDFNSQWGRALGLGNDSNPFRVYEKENGDIHVFGEMQDTSVGYPIMNIDGYWLTLDGATGNTLRTRKYHGIRSEWDRNTFYDARPTPDGGYVMAGFSNDLSSSVVLPNQRGWIVKVDSSGCLGPDDPQCQPAGVAQPGWAEMQIALYPNPVNDVLTVALPQGIEAQIELVDMQGRVAMQQALQGGTQQVNVQSLLSGNYLYRITEKGRLIARGKLVKR